MVIKSKSMTKKNLCLNIGGLGLCKLFFAGCLLLSTSQVSADLLQFEESHKTGNVVMGTRLYQDPQYETEQSPELQLTTDQTIYVEAYADVRQITEVKLVMENYWATPSTSPDDENKVLLIENGCPVSTSIPISILNNGVSDRVRLSHKVFKFSASSTLTLHCSLKLCLDNCEQICISRRRRAISKRVDEENLTFSSTIFVETNTTNYQD